MGFFHQKKILAVTCLEEEDIEEKVLCQTSNHQLTTPNALFNLLFYTSDALWLTLVLLSVLIISRMAYDVEANLLAMVSVYLISHSLQAN